MAPVTGDQRLNRLLFRYADLFAAKGEPNGSCNMAELKIETEGPPLTRRGHTAPLNKRLLIEIKIE